MILCCAVKEPLLNAILLQFDIILILPTPTIHIIIILLLVFSPWAGLGRDQSSVRRLVRLWYTVSWASS